MPEPSSLRDVQLAFAAHIRDPDHAPAPEAIEDRRMAIYRELFFNNIESFLSNSYPVIRRLFGEQRWRSMVRDFMIHHRAHTPLFPELPREFLKFIENHRGPDQGDPPFLLELAHYEWAELALTIAEDEFDPPQISESAQLLNHQLQKSPLAWLLSYHYPVHQIRKDFQPSKPGAQPTHLVVYRTAEDSVKFLELNAVSARLLSLIDNTAATGLEHLSRVADDMGADRDQQFVRNGTKLLSDLAERQIIGLATQ